MQDKDYRRFRDFLEHACGIVLGDHKQYLVASRLSPLMSAYGIPGLGALMERIETGRSLEFKTLVIDAMTTNETSWFRDPAQFDALREDILPDLAERRPTALRFWSAGCSSGQEPYSISIAVEAWQARTPSGRYLRADILATDIAPTMLDYAQKGLYRDHALTRGLSPEYRERYFRPVDECWEVIPEIRARVRFRQWNLLSRYDTLGRFDVVFCRNVLIYFANTVKRDIVNRFAGVLNPGGYLFLGSSESLAGLSEAFEMVRYRGSIVYRLK